MIVIKERKNRLTGTTVLVIDNRDGSFDDTDLPWFTLCDDHGNICSHPTRKLALWHAPSPEWCGECQRVLEKNTPQYRSDYERGWRYSQTDVCSLDHLDRTGAPDAAYDGYMDFATDRPKWHSLICFAAETGNHGDEHCTLRRSE